MWPAAVPRCRKCSDAPLGPRIDTGNIAKLSSYESGMTNSIPDIEVLLDVVSGRGHTIVPTTGSRGSKGGQGAYREGSRVAQQSSVNFQ